MHCDRQRHASNVLAYLSEPTVIVLYNEPGWLSYVHIRNCPSMTDYAYKHRPSNCANILPVLEGCGPLGVAMLTAVVGIVGIPVLPAIVGVGGVALLATVAGATHRKEGMKEETDYI